LKRRTPVAEPGEFSSERAAWQDILLEQALLRPKWQLQDVYKLVFQAALGSEHAAPGEAAAWQWLEQEIACLGAGPAGKPVGQPADPPLEPISPDGRLARVNLRPYLASGGSPDGVLKAFLRTAALWQGRRDTLQQYLGWAIELVESGETGLQPVEAKTCFQHLAEAGYPPAHHSSIYRELYRPAYRVVLLDLLP
jgi:hypothetical protein